MAVRFTPPQLQVLRYLRDGWHCTTAGTQPPQVRQLLWYSFCHEQRQTSVAGSTLASLQRRALIGWEATTVTLAYDGSTIPGYTLALTAVGQAALQGARGPLNVQV